MSQPTDPSRDLLFGLLALQNGLIDQHGLVGALQAWAMDKTRPLADYLVGRGDLDALDRAALEALAARHLGRHGSIEHSLAAVTVGHSIRESMATLGDPELTTMVGHVGSADLSTQGGDADRTVGYTVGTATSDVGTATSDSERFRVLRLHARGGLGAVFVALDGELNREVALKQIVDSHADDPVSRQRFLQEAEITGGLEHPGIVPVYSLGTYTDGRPYYAMRFIRGDSLKEAIDSFHQRTSMKIPSPLVGEAIDQFQERANTKSPSPALSARERVPQDVGGEGRVEGRGGGSAAAPAASRDLELRKLLGHFLDVCNAIDYAHSRGVLHRDIKPGNVIVGKHGETLVVDWGLAKPLGSVDPGKSAGERALLPSRAAGSSATLPGSTMGTPAYMSPEQAAGDLDRLEPKSDVYALGATLYYLLTGRPAFENQDLGELLKKVQRGDFVAPRQLDPSIDKPLEAICKKAMAKSPDDRYPTPRALADDIERWLADEPVKAYPEERLERLGRWLRHHRTWTYAAVAALLGISVAATIGVVVVDRARRREAVIRKEAETNFNMAQSAVDDYLTSVSENTLFKLQDSVDIRKLRHELLNSALTYYKSFVNQRSHDPLLRRQLAHAYFRVGGITREVASPNQAIAAYQEAQGIWEPLAAAHPDDHELKGRLAQSYLAVGKLRNTVTNLDIDGALKSLTRARAILEPLAAANPLEADYQSSLADCYAEIASVRARQQRSAESLILLEKAAAIQKSLIGRFPDQHAYQKTLAEITNILGFAYHRLGNEDQALESFREVQRICANVLEQVKVGPRPLWPLNLLALSHYNIGFIHEERRELAAALESFERARDYRSTLVDSHPSVTEYQQKLAMSCRQVAMLQHEVKEDAEAMLSIQRSINVLQALVRAQPDQAGYHSDLGLSWNYLGCLYDAARKNPEALAAFEKAVAEQQLAVDKANADDEYRGYLANHLDNLAEQFVNVGRVAMGLPLYRRALRLYREHSAAHPQDRVFALDLIRSLFRLGTTERHDGDFTAAQQSLTDARLLLERQSSAAPGDAALRLLHAAALDQEANALFDQGLAEEARERLERALVLLRPLPHPATPDKELAQGRRLSSELDYVLGFASDRGSEADVERRLRSEALWDLARVLRAQKLVAEAERADTERLAMWKARPPSELVDLAFNQLERALVIGLGKTPVSDRARAVRELELEQAAANVRLAISRGFNDLRKLRSHPDSTFLLNREELKVLIMDMAFPGWPFGAE